MVHIPKPPSDLYDEKLKPLTTTALAIVPPPKPPGRPSIFNQGVAERICELIMAGGPESRIKAITARSDMPSETTFYRWLSSNADFRESYARAKAIQAEAMAEELLAIVDDGSNDYVKKFGKDGEFLGFALDTDHIQRSKLRYEARRWLMAKYLPKVYGDKSEMLVSGNPAAPIETKLVIEFVDPGEVIEHENS